MLGDLSCVCGRGPVKAITVSWSWLVAVGDEKRRKNSETTWELEFMEPGE